MMTEEEFYDMLDEVVRKDAHTIIAAYRKSEREGLIDDGSYAAVKTLLGAMYMVGPELYDLIASNVIRACEEVHSSE